MDVLNRVPVQEQNLRFVQRILKKYVTDIMKKKQWQKQQDVSAVRMHSV